MKKRLIYNTLLLTGVSLYMRTLSLLFQVYVSNKIGASGIGLFTLIISVQALAVTLATSGIRYAVTRLVSEELGMGRPGGVDKVMKSCFSYAAFFSTLALGVLYFGADYIGSVWVQRYTHRLIIENTRLRPALFVIVLSYGGLFHSGSESDEVFYCPDI